MAPVLQGRTGELFYSCAADVRSALAAADVPSNARLFADLAAEEEQRESRASGWSDIDVDADLPLPAHCLSEWTQLSTAADRIRAVQMHRLARFALVRILRQEGGADTVDAALTYGDVPPRGSDGGGSDAGGLEFISTEPLMQVLERLTSPEDYLSLNATMRTRLGTARRDTGRALAAFLGLPQMLDATVTGRVPFNRVERLLYRVSSAQLTIGQMNAVDDLAVRMRPETSLDQFERRIREYIRANFDPPVRAPESIHRDRGLRLVSEPDGSGALIIQGPLLPLTLSYQRTRATARALRRQELKGLDVDARGSDPGDAEGTLQTRDDRTIAQYMFDLAVGAVPQTDVRLVRAAEDSATESSGDDSGGEESFVASVACPTDGAWLRKQATVTVSMSLSTLVGLGDDPGTLEHSTPLPAAQARQAAAKATVWHRILYDPATGTVTDEATRTYKPTDAMRRAVEQKWRSCMAPGCTRSSTLCEIDHCEAFCHDDPGRGGPTHPCNLIPLCVMHHQLKTNGVIRLRRVSGDEVEWVLPLGVVTRTVAPPADPAPGMRQHSVAEEILGVNLRSAEFSGSRPVGAGPAGAGQVDPGQVDSGQVDSGQTDSGSVNSASVYSGAVVRELLHGAPRRADVFSAPRLFGATRITVTLPWSPDSAPGGSTPDGPVVDGPDDDPDDLSDWTDFINDPPPF